jgi:hypothetical protein
LPFILLSYVAALGGTHLFARLWSLGRGAALLAGITYALGGYMVGLTSNLLYLMAAAAFPWALWGAERFLRQPSASRAAAALPLMLILLSGDPQSFAMCNGMLLVLVLLRPSRTDMLRAAPWAGVLIVLGALLSAVQLLQVLGILKDAHPNAPTFELATRFSFHPLRLLDLAFGPLFLHRESGTVPTSQLANELFQSGMGALWTYSVHLGLPALLRARVGVRAARAVGVTAAVLLPRGDWRPLDRALRRLGPRQLRPGDRHLLAPLRLALPAGADERHLHRHGQLRQHRLVRLRHPRERRRLPAVTSGM